MPRRFFEFVLREAQSLMQILSAGIHLYKKRSTSFKETTEVGKLARGEGFLFTHLLSRPIYDFGTGVSFVAAISVSSISNTACCKRLSFF